MERVTLKEVAEYIREELQRPGTSYKSVIGTEGYKISIRVSDHRSNDRNNIERTSARVLSFISSGARKQDIQLSPYEWVINENGMTDDYQTLEEILSDWFE